MNHIIQIIQCGQFAHMQRIDHHTLIVLPSLVQILAEKQKLECRARYKTHKSLLQQSC